MDAAALASKLGLTEAKVTAALEKVRAAQKPATPPAQGTTPTDGATLRAKFGLFDTWAYFTAIRGEKAPSDTPGSDTSGGATIPPRSFSFKRPDTVGVLQGTVVGSGGRGVVQVRRDGRWIDVADVKLSGGAYRYAATAAGTYRVVFGDAAGPSIRL